MRQAARSCKQNIVEGVSDSTVSMEMGIKLIGVARGSLRELREDYGDYLRQNDLTTWNIEDSVTLRARTFCRECNDPKEFVDKCRACSDEAVANIMLTEIRQLDSLLTSTLKKMEDEFVENGGLKEQMSQVRRNWRKENLGY